MLSGEFDEGQLKYLIGRCEFFVGSRMHACIAALSQGIPAVGIAYSRKFAGVLRSIAAEELVADACSLSAEQILNAISDAYEQRARLKARLSSRMPQVRATVLDLFPNIRCSLRQATA